MRDRGVDSWSSSMLLEICWKHREAVRPDCDPCAGIDTTSALQSRPASLPTVVHHQLEPYIGYILDLLLTERGNPVESLIMVLNCHMKRHSGQR